jgi:hypothetical protein
VDKDHERMKYRRLTRDEAARLGVSYGAKRQVAAGVKRVTKSTKLYSNREAHEATIKARARANATTPKERRAASKLTKERYAERRTQSFFTKGGKEVKSYNDLSEKEFFRVLKRAGNKQVVPHFLAERNSQGGSGTHGKPKWSSGSRIEADEISDPDDLEDWLDRWGFTSVPTRYGVQVVSQ